MQNLMNLIMLFIMMSEAKTKARETKWTGLKILTPKQMLQRLQ